MTQFKATGYHSTDIADKILEEGIDFQLPKNDVFLGRGFYLWRDSYHRASSWKKNQYKDDLEVLEVELNCPKEDMLNFTSIKWNKELDIIKLYIKYFKPKKIYFGEFLDFLIDGLDVDIKLVMIMDLKNQLTKLHIQDPDEPKNKSIFSFGDIQICIKSIDVKIDNIKKVSIES